MAFVAPVLGNIALNLAVGVGLSVLAGAIAPAATAKSQVATQRGFSFEMTSGETVPYSAVFGIGRARGSLHYWNEYGAGDNYHLQLVIRIGIGEHDGMETFLVDEKPVTLAGSNSDAKGRSVAEYTVSGTPYLWVKYYTGAAGQAADPELVAMANPAGRWTANSRMTGWAYMIVTIRYNADLYGSTLPRFGSIWRGLKVYDWRVPGAIWGDHSTYVFSKNPLVIRLNFRRGIYVNGVRVLGMGFPAAAQDMAYYTAAANRCDEDFYDPESNTTFPVFEYGREIGDDEEKLSVLRELDASCAGSSFKRGGADAPLPAQQLVSVMTLTDADRLLRPDGSRYPVLADRKGAASAKRTMWHGQFVSADADWDLAPFTPRINAALESVLGGRRATTLDQPYERLQERAQLRAEIALRRQIYAATRTETFGPKALSLELGDAITRVCEWGSMLMVVERTNPLPDRTGVEITMSQWANAIVPASGESFVTLPAAAGAGPADPSRTIAVSGGSIVAHPREGGGAVHPFGKATWSAITDPNVEQVMIRLWPTSGTEADDKEDFFADSQLTSTKLVGPLSPLTTYTYKFRPIRSDIRTTVWSNTAEFTTGAEVAPAVADGSIGLSALTAAFRNEVGALYGGDGQASLYDRIQELRDQVEALAQQTAGVAAVHEHQRKRLTARVDTAQADITQELLVRASDDNALALSLATLSATVGTNTAAIASEASTRASADSALGSLIDEVAVEVGDVSAGTLFKMEATTAPSGAAAAIEMMARITAGGTAYPAGLRVDVMDLGGGSYQGRVALFGDQVVVVNGSTVAALFQTGTTYFNTAVIPTLTSDLIDVVELVGSSIFTTNLTVGTGNFQNLSVSTIKIQDAAVTALDAVVQQNLTKHTNTQHIISVNVDVDEYPVMVGGYLDATTCVFSVDHTITCSIQVLVNGSWVTIVADSVSGVGANSRHKLAKLSALNLPGPPGTYSYRMNYVSSGTSTDTGDNFTMHYASLSCAVPQK